MSQHTPDDKDTFGEREVFPAIENPSSVTCEACAWLPVSKLVRLCPRHAHAGEMLEALERIERTNPDERRFLPDYERAWSDMTLLVGELRGIARAIIRKVRGS